MVGFKAGDAFFIRDNRARDKGHLYVVLCAPFGRPLVVLAVIFNTKTLETDNTLILSPQDHSFITRPTAVSFDSLRTLEVAPLMQLEALGATQYFERKDPVTPELLERMIQGALESDMTPKDMVTLLKAQLNITGGE